MILKHIFIFLVSISFILAYSYSYNALGISNISLFVAIGIDSGDDDDLQVTFQFTDISPVSQSGSTETKVPSTFTINAPSVHAAISMMSTYTGKETNLSHCKLIVISEELASSDISSLISSLSNNSQIRPSTNIVISKNTAKDYLDNSSPIFDNLITKHYETFVNSGKYTGYTANITISDFFSALNSSTKEPVAILGKVSNYSSPFNSQIENYSGTENTGLAIFRDGVLVGELNESQTLAFQSTTNQVEGFLISIPNPYNTQELLDIYITPTRKTSVDVDLINHTPLVSISYAFSGRIYSTSQSYDFLDPSILENISISCNQYLSNIFEDFLYTTSKVYNSDICDIGQYSKEFFSTLNDFSNFDWTSNYKNCFFTTTIDTNVKSGYLLSKPAKEVL